MLYNTRMVEKDGKQDKEIDMLRKMMHEQLDISRANNHMLKKMLRVHKVSQFMTIVRWLVIIGIAVGAFYFVQPLIDNVQNFYEQVDSVFTLSK